MTMIIVVNAVIILPILIMISYHTYRANKRITRLIEALGISEYEFINETILYPFIGKGMLQDIYKIQREDHSHQLNGIHRLELMENHLKIEYKKGGLVNPHYIKKKK